MEISKNAKARAMAAIREKIENNKEYNRKAETEAKSQVEKLVRLFNNSVDDRIVEVEFIGE